MPRRCFQNQPISLGRVQLDDAGRHHLCQVLGLKKGDQVELFNGDGHAYTGTLTDISKKAATVDIENVEHRPLSSPLRTHLALALIARDKWSWAIQKAVELGVDEVTPLITDHSTYTIPKDKQAKKLSHWESILHNACEQCGRNQLPILNPITPLPEFILNEHTWILDPHTGKGISDSGLDTSDLTVLIGPEGGWSQQERVLFSSSNAKMISLGPRILRAETAPLAVLSIAQSMKGDL